MEVSSPNVAVTATPVGRTVALAVIATLPTEPVAATPVGVTTALAAVVTLPTADTAPGT